MDMVKLRNKPSRNGFDLSSKINFTAKCGELLPVMCKEVIPGDKVTIDLSSFTRTMPVNTAAFARIREYYDFYFVPFSHLWNRANTVLSQMDYNKQHATSLTDVDSAAYMGELPFVSAETIATYLRNVQGLENQYKWNMFGFNRGKCSAKLLQYLGYGNYDVFNDTSKTGGFNYNPDLNILPLLAYQKIYSDYFRNEQWEKPQPSTFNVDYLDGTNTMSVPVPSSTGTGADFYEHYNFFDLRYCNWNKDLYHGILPKLNCYIELNFS